jgi:hypothetical protein
MPQNSLARLFLDNMIVCPGRRPAGRLAGLTFYTSSHQVHVFYQRCFLQEKNTECCSISLSKFCINIHICDLSIKGLTWILCSHDSLAKRQLQQFWQNQKRLSWLLLHVKPHCISLHKDFAILCTFILQKTSKGNLHNNLDLTIFPSLTYEEVHPYI